MLLLTAIGGGYAILTPVGETFARALDPTNQVRRAAQTFTRIDPQRPSDIEPLSIVPSWTPDTPLTAPPPAPMVRPAPPVRSRIPAALPELDLRPAVPREPQPAAPLTPREPWPPAPATPREPWPARVSGRVLDHEGRPVPGASVVADGVERRTAADGTFTLETLRPDATVFVKHPGFERVLVEPTRDAVDVVLRPAVRKALYVTYYGIGDRSIRGRVLEAAARTEVNAVVIDVKGDRGWILYPTEIPLALQVGAQGPGTLRNFDALMADLKARGLYTIARVVTFKDNILARARPELAIIDTRTGEPWIDNEGLAWLDAFREEAWAYNIAIAKEAVRRGFDEVQFDYVRFPTDGRLSAARYSRPNTAENRINAIAGFLARARREIGPTGAFVAADLFGYTAFNPNDTDIGQRIEELAPHLDYISPMVYPSGYHRGIPGFRNPVEHPYRVVHESVRLIRQRAAHTRARVRPWLQDFRDYAFDRRPFGVDEIRAQIKGSEDAGGIGWMLWNPKNNYTTGALRLKEAHAER